MNTRRIFLAFLAGGMMIRTQAAWSAWTVDQEVEAGYQSVDQSAPEAKFQEYKDYPNGVVIPNYSLEVQDERTTITFDAQNVKQEDQSYSIDINRDSKWKVEAGWNQTPHRFSETSRTLYNETEPNVWRLPDNVQGVLQGLSNSAFISSYTTLSTASRDVDLGIRNDQGRMALGYRANDRLRFNLGYTDEKIKGKKPYCASFGRSYVLQLPDVIDYEVRTLSAGSQFNTKKAQFGIDYSMQAFDNEIESMVWDNAKRTTVATTGTERTVEGRAARPPDNMAHYGTARAGFELPANTRFTADATFGYLEANEDLLPYTINPSQVSNFVSAPIGFDASLSSSLPVSKSGGRAITFNQAYRLTNRVLKPLTLGAGFRSYQYNDKTPETQFAGRTLFDQYFTTGTIAPKRFSTRKDVADATADWDIFRSLSAGLRYSLTWDNREHREVKDTEEHAGTASLDYRPLMGLLIRGSYTRAKRTGEDFEIEDYEDANGRFIETPGLRRYDVSDRDRDQGDLQVQWTPGPVSLVVHGAMGFDQFGGGKGDLTAGTTEPATMYGLLNNRFQRAGADIGWEANEWLALDAYYAFEQNEARQRSNYNGGSTLNQDSSTDWTADQLDRYHTAGIKAHIVAVPQRVNLNLGYELTQSVGSVQFENVGSGAATVSSVPTVTPTDTETTKQDITVNATVRLTPALSLVFGYLYEKYDVYDWAHDNVPEVGGLAAGRTNIYLQDNALDYQAHVGTQLLKYRFSTGTPTKA